MKPAFLQKEGRYILQTMMGEDPTRNGTLIRRQLLLFLVKRKNKEPHKKQ